MTFGPGRTPHSRLIVACNRIGMNSIPYEKGCEMWRFLFIAFLLAHGAIHLAMWIPQPKADAPFDAGRSWLLGNQRLFALILAVAIAVVLIAAGVGLWAHADWWRAAAIVGLTGSLGLMILFFQTWFVPIETVNAALIVSLLWLQWPSATMVGA